MNQKKYEDLLTYFATIILVFWWNTRCSLSNTNCLKYVVQSKCWIVNLMHQQGIEDVRVRHLVTMPLWMNFQENSEPAHFCSYCCLCGAWIAPPGFMGIHFAVLLVVTDDRPGEQQNQYDSSSGGPWMSISNSIYRCSVILSTKLTHWLIALKRVVCRERADILEIQKLQLNGEKFYWILSQVVSHILQKTCSDSNFRYHKCSFQVGPQ